MSTELAAVLSALGGFAGFAALIYACVAAWRTWRSTASSLDAGAAQRAHDRYLRAYERADELDRQLSKSQAKVEALAVRLELMTEKIEHLEGSLASVTAERDTYRAQLDAILEHVGRGVIAGLERRPIPPASEDTGVHPLPVPNERD